MLLQPKLVHNTGYCYVNIKSINGKKDQPKWLTLYQANNLQKNIRDPQLNNLIAKNSLSLPR